MTILKMVDLDLRGKRVLIRVDFNVPIRNGKITSEQRLLASVPTLQLAVERGAKVMILSHLGQPKEGEFDEAFSLRPVADWLSSYFKQPVRLVRDWLQGVEVADGEMVLCENVRFNQGEKKDDERLARQMAGLCDLFVMDAFATAHRAQASTHGVAKFAPIACAGPLLVRELEALSLALENPNHPLAAVTGGSKVSTKLGLLENLLGKVDYLIVGGGIANTFLLAQGYSIGKSLCEVDFVEKAQVILQKAQELGVQFPLPVDVVVAKEIGAQAVGKIKTVDRVAAEEFILDIGPQTRNLLKNLLQKAKTIVWNGPVGMFELSAFSQGTEEIARVIAGTSAFTIAGGGDTLAAIEQFKIDPGAFSYLSTAGGAFLEYLQGIELPAVQVLKDKVS